MRSEEQETLDAELWWEWNQRHIPIKTARSLDYLFGFLGGNRFHTGQPLIGLSLLFFYGLIIAAANYLHGAWIMVGIPVYIHEWVTLKKRTKIYNYRLWIELVEKWNPDTQLKQPAGT